MKDPCGGCNHACLAAEVNMSRLLGKCVTGKRRSGEVVVVEARRRTFYPRKWARLHLEDDDYFFFCDVMDLGMEQAARIRLVKVGDAKKRYSTLLKRLSRVRGTGKRPKN